jgi:hypothetical protein
MQLKQIHLLLKFHMPTISVKNNPTWPIYSFNCLLHFTFVVFHLLKKPKLTIFSIQSKIIDICFFV